MPKSMGWVLYKTLLKIHLLLFYIARTRNQDSRIYLGISGEDINQSADQFSQCHSIGYQMSSCFVLPVLCLNSKTSIHFLRQVVEPIIRSTGSSMSYLSRETRDSDVMGTYCLGCYFMLSFYYLGREGRGLPGVSIVCSFYWAPILVHEDSDPERR